MASKVDTYDEGLQSILTAINKVKLIADANLPFVISLETQVLEEFRSPERRMQAQGMIPGEQQNPAGMGALGLPGGMGGMGGGGMGSPPPSFAGAGVPGMQTAPPSNPDELRRILTAGG